MGWTLSSIIISPGKEIDYKDLLSKLGYKNLTEIEDRPFDSAMSPENGIAYLGIYKNNLILCAANLPLAFFDNSLSVTEKQLIDSFPASEICAVSVQSIINHFGFALIKNGEKIRVKAGDADIGTVIDWGQPIEEELNLLSKSKVNDQGQRLYYLGETSDEPYAEHQVGENFIFEIFKRYTGESMDADDDLLDTNLKGFRFLEESPVHSQFTTEWEGEYLYGDGYKDVVKGKKEGFLLTFDLTDGQIKGFCIDANKQSDDPAIITGFIIDNFIAFIKRYPVRYIVDEKGTTQKEPSKKPFNIAYSGLYDPPTESFKGIWRIENRNLWGEWRMKRKNTSN